MQKCACAHEHFDSPEPFSFNLAVVCAALPSRIHAVQSRAVATRGIPEAMKRVYRAFCPCPADGCNYAMETGVHEGRGKELAHRGSTED